jgi:ABC-type nitrate/sulfonate/bicarbonate transport system substrate-binding protein
LPLVAVAALYQQNPVVFISLADSGIRKAADFAGHSVGVKIGTSPDILYQALMKKVGVDRTSIREIPVQFDMSTFFSGQVQVWPAYIINEAIIAKDQGFAVNIINPFDYGIYDYADVVFTTEEFLKEHPDTVRSFLKALLKGWKDSVADQSMAVQTLLRMNDGLEAGHETKMMAAVVPLVTAGIGARIGWMDAAKWQATYDMLNQQGLLEEPFAVASAYTLEHIQAIYK